MDDNLKNERIIPVKIKRAPAIIKKREQTKLTQEQEEVGIFSELFGSIAPPQQKKITKSSFEGIDVNSISVEQLSALKSQNFALWVMHSSMQVDNRPFNFDRHRYLLPLYMDDSKEIVLMKAAQMGATIWMLLRLLWFLAYNVAKACLYFPTLDAVSKLSKDRLKPIIHSNEELSRLVHDTDTIGYKRIGEKSSLYLQHMGGEATKDSTPFDFVCFDEVRLLNAADIDQALERISHSEYKMVMKVSTAGHPGCFSGDTRVVVKHKEFGWTKRITIKKLLSVYHDYKILSWSDNNIVTWRDIIAVESTGIKKIINISLSNGVSHKCTPDHLFSCYIAPNMKTTTWVPIEQVPVYNKEYCPLSVQLWPKIIRVNYSNVEKEPTCWVDNLAIDSMYAAGEEEVYDIEVDGYPAFILADSGCLVHNSDIHKNFLGGTQNYWHVKCSCFPLNQKIVARRKGIFVTEAISLKELQHKWPYYEVLSWNVHHKIWQYKDITAFHYNGTRNVIQAIFRNGAKVVVTPDHKFYSHAGKKNARTIATPIGSIPTERDEKNIYASRVLVARQIPETAHLGYGKGCSSYKQVPFDNETLYAVGAYIAEGSWKTETNLTFSKVEGKVLRDRVANWARLHNLPISFNSHGIDVSLASRLDLIHLFEECGKGCENKKIPSIVMMGSVVQLSYVLEGCLDGDGHRYKKTKNSNSNVEWSYSTTSETLQKQLIFVCLRLGKPVYQLKRKEKEGKKQCWEIYYNPQSRFNQFCLGDEGMMSGVSLKEKKSFGRTTVGCISVEDNHNFVLADSGLLVHNCPDGFVPSECWPDCMAVTRDEVYLRCPKCGTKIVDPQNGQYVPHNPSAAYPSYHISQLLSNYITPAQIWDAWQRTQNLKEFYNAKLGKPYIDEENQPIKDDDLLACENHDLLWGPSKTKYGGRIQRAMGIDQMSGINYIVVAERFDSKKRIVHLEIVDDRNPIYQEAGKRVSPFKRGYDLMKEMDIDLCVIDAMPNINEAMEFAMTYPRRVFVAHYIETMRDMVQWGDRPKYKMNVKKGGPRIKFKYTCLLSRYQSIDFVLSEIANRNFEWPHPRNLVQVCRSIDSGLYEPLHIAETHFYRHLKSIVRQKTWIDEAAGRFKMEWVNLGLDPHFCHSLNLCNIALERLRRQPIMTFADNV